MPLPHSLSRGLGQPWSSSGQHQDIVHHVLVGVDSIHHQQEQAATIDMPRPHSLSRGLGRPELSSGQRPGIAYRVLIGGDNRMVCLVLRLYWQ